MMNHCFAVLLLVVPTAALADVYNCNGRWTDKPCAPGEVSHVIKTEVRRSPNAATEAEDKQRRFTVFHELNMKSAEALRNYGIRFATIEIGKLCMKKETEFEDCKKAADAERDRLERLMHDAQVLAVQREANEIERKRLAVEEKKAEAPTTVIIERRDTRSYRDRFLPPQRSFPGQPPISNPGVQINQQIHIEQNTHQENPPQRPTNPPPTPVRGSGIGVFR